ncbi:nuclear pore complex protein Nup153 isoform X2 [Parasteatoda tepidariorum]|uniref:nuclear pore complex protein Nup153 isoform X2 n=1 Tax=Parasteatoda tepidariorum TaxID=114398 RepID=UPI001C723662|nr:nuclear pore complex protein Nup153 isoform X2 [Parasteatoda tepidariorum]
MDKRSLHNKRKKNSSRTHERSNQGIFDKVASKVKGFLNPWLSIWNSVTEEDCSSSSDNEDALQEPELVPQITLQSAKRPRLSDHSLPGCSSNSLHIEPTREIDYTSSLPSRGINRLKLHEHSVPGCSTDVFSQASQEQDYSIQNSTHGSKRQRLNLDQNPNLLSAGTQTWLEVPERPNLYSQASAHIPSSNVQNSLIENKDSSVILNGDDHSENSEGSASTSGCSSLVSHKDRINCMSSIMLSESDIKSRRDAASQKGKIPGDINCSRMSLWSSGGSSAVRSVRSPTVMQTNQPGFSLSTFIGSSKPSDRKVASPFYQGKTSYGGASASRRMPPAAAPYQVDKPLRNQIKYRSNEPKDSYEGMSSAARRILQTLEKMSSPVTDAKKIPNTNKSPIDLSLYLMPPKHRKNFQSSTPAGPSRGPPIADISTISKLTTLKNYGQKRFQNSILDSPTLLSEKTSSILNVLPQILQSSPEMPSLPSGGGKMRNKLHQQHQPAAKNKFNANEMESRMSDYIDTIPDPTDLPEITLPITTLPTISFGQTTVKNTCDSSNKGKNFTFSNPIELVPNSELSNPTLPVISNLSSSFLSQPDVNKNQPANTFTFSNPIELENPIVTVSTNSNTQCKLNFNSKSVESTWKCSACWVNNPDSVTKCQCCENPKEVLSNASKTFSTATMLPFKPSSPKTPSNDELQKPVSSVLPLSTAGFGTATANSASTWACSECWVSNPATKEKCACCEAPCPSKGKITGGSSNKESRSINSSSNSAFGCASIPASSSSQSGFNFSGLSKVPQISSTWECDACLVRNEMDKQKCVACETLRPNKSNLSGFSFKGTNEAKSNATLNFNSPLNSAVSSGFLLNTTTASSSTSATTTGFTLSTTVKPVSDGFTLNTSEPTASSVSVTPASTSTCTFGSGTLSSVKPSSISSENKVAPTADVPFKFGDKTIATSDPAPSFGSSNNLFTFGTKSVATNSPKSAVSSSENPTPVVGNMPQKPIFGNSPLSSSFGKQTTGELKIPPVLISKSNPLFQFGSTVSSGETSWECSSCHSKNNGDKDKCASCSAAQIDKINKNNIDLPLKEILWNCSSCPTINSGDIAKCISCDSLRENKNFPSKGAGDVKSKDSIASFNMPSTTSASSSPFTFAAVASSSTTTAAIPASLTTTAVTTSLTVNSAISASSTTNAASVSSAITTTATTSTGFSFGATTNAPSAGTFVFGAKSEPVSTASSLFKFGTATLSTSKPSTTGFENNLSAAAVAPFQFGKSSVATTTAPTFGAASNTFTFGAAKSESNNSIKPTVSSSPAFGTSQSVFGTAVSNAMSTFGTSGGLNLAAPTVSKTNPLFQFGANAPSAEASWECSSCRVKNNSDKTTCSSCGTLRQEKSISGFTFKGTNDAKSNTSALNFKAVATTSSPSSGFTFNAPSTTTAASTGFTFSATPASSTGNFVFGAKSEATTASTPSFAFGSGSASTAKPSITTFENNLSSTPAVPFQFGNQPTIATSAPTIGFGGAASSAFAFGNKPETVNSLQPAASSTQMPVPAFGSAPTQPMFGNSTTPAFGKQAPGGFNFGLPTSSNSTPVFQFGVEKKQATPQSGFSFGTPSQDAMNQNFQPQFNISTPQSFNFGATSSAGPFQFAASSDSSQATSAGPRKIRKAFRRMK